MVSTRFRAIVALVATTLTVILTLLLVVSTGWRPVRSGEVSAHTSARIVARTSHQDTTPTLSESVTLSIVTVKKSVFHRTTTQRGTVRPSHLVDLYPKVSGELRSLSVNIGDRVRQGQVVAVIDAPELRAELRKGQAMLELAQARAQRVGAAVRVAEAIWRSEWAKVDVAAAELKSSDTVRVRREMERKRLKELSDRNTVERRVLAEEDKWLESAEETLLAKKALLAVAQADVQTAKAKVDAARAELEEARADVRVAEANQAGPELLAASARVIAPIDGIVTHRNYHVGAVVRTAASGDSEPLLTIIQASQVRVEVQIPDCDAVFLDKGDPVTFRPDALVDREYQGTISRTPGAEEQGTVRAEFDLDNANGQLRPGQAGRVTVMLEEHSYVLAIPVEAILGPGYGTLGLVSCYRLVDGRAVRTPIRVGMVNRASGTAEVLDGLKEGDAIVPNWRIVEDRDRKYPSSDRSATVF
jgi:HlyD family secretion protein